MVFPLLPTHSVSMTRLFYFVRNKGNDATHNERVIVQNVLTMSLQKLSYD